MKKHESRKVEPGEKIFYYDNNNILESRVDFYSDYWVDEDNFLHNESGVPCWIHYYDHERKYKEYIEYRCHGILHNLFGPADVYFETNDNVVTKELYFIEGKELTKKQWKEKTYIERNRLEILNEI